MRSFDVTWLAKDVMRGLSWLAADVLGSTSTVAAGLTVTANGTLTLSLAAGRVYELANTDTTSPGGVVAADTTQILQQGQIGTNSVVLSTAALGVGQSQWALIEVGFTQTDAIRSSDPTSGLLYFFNSNNPAQPLQGQGGNNQTLATVRQAVCTVKVIYGTAATTGSEAPPNADTGFVGLYLIDLAYGQTVVNQGNVLTAGPSAGLNVPANYPAAPFLAGLLQSHHNGANGQAPKIKLASEVQGNLPATNMPVFATTSPAAAASRTFVVGDHYTMVLRSNTGTLMTDTIPGTGVGVLAAGTRIKVMNTDATALYSATVATGATLDGVVGGGFILGPGQRAEFYSDGTNYRMVYKPSRVRFGAATTLFADFTNGSDTNAITGLSATTGAYKSLQAAINWIVNNVDYAGNALTLSSTGAFTAGISNLVPFFGATIKTGLTISFASGSSVAASSSSCFAATGALAGYAVTTASGTAVVLTATGSGSAQGSAFYAENGANVQISGAVNIGACTQSQLQAWRSGVVIAAASYTVSGGAAEHLQCNQGGQIIAGTAAITVTLTGTPAYTSAFAVASDSGSALNYFSSTVTFSGAATGTRYNATVNGSINTNGGGASFFPGNAGGTTATGGQYV